MLGHLAFLAPTWLPGDSPSARRTGPRRTMIAGLDAGLSWYSSHRTRWEVLGSVSARTDGPRTPRGRGDAGAVAGPAPISPPMFLWLFCARYRPRMLMGATGWHDKVLGPWGLPPVRRKSAGGSASTTASARGPEATVEVVAHVIEQTWGFKGSRNAEVMHAIPQALLREASSQSKRASPNPDELWADVNKPCLECARQILAPLVAHHSHCRPDGVNDTNQLRPVRGVAGRRPYVGQ
jgi:hypothetical protein